MAVEYTTDALVTAIQRHVRSEMDKVVAEEAERASERVRNRLAEMAPQMAMALLKHYDIARDRNEIVIRVRDDIQPGTNP